MSRAWYVSMRTLLILGLSTLLVSCGGDGMQDLRQYVKKVKARKPGRIEPLPEIKQIETFVYSQEDSRNPFQLSQASEAEEMAQAGDGLAPDFNRRKEELEQFPLDSIRMVGTVDMESTVWGLVRTSDKPSIKSKLVTTWGRTMARLLALQKIKLN